jgi:two-component system sensor histidine kinase/response regulator
VLLNFISNAVKFTEKGEIGIKVVLEKETETWVDVQFEVVDTGCGMDESSLHSVLNSKYNFYFFS